MKKLILTTLAITCFSGQVLATEPVKGTESEFKKYHKAQNTNMESIITKLKESPLAIISENSDDIASNARSTNLSIEINGIDSETGESCTVTVTKRNKVHTPLYFYRATGLFGSDLIEAMLPKVTTELTYGVSIANSEYTKDIREIGRSTYYSEKVKSIKANGVELSYSNVSPAFLGNQENAKIVQTKNGDLVFSAERKPFIGFESKFSKKIEPATSSCKVQLD